MAEVEVGSVVISKAGRDKGRFMAVIAVDGNYCELVDGRTHRASRPKKKKRMHLQATHSKIEGITDILKSDSADSKIRKILAEIESPIQPQEVDFE